VRCTFEPYGMLEKKTAQAFFVLVAFLIALTASWERHVVAQASPCLATTASGDVAGLLSGDVCTYLGVPYAAPPTENLRWRPPAPRPSSPATVIATVPPPACPQFNLAGAVAGNEDCLMLNIWAPSPMRPGRGVPVLVWLHPGSFLAASANLAASNGRRFAEERGVVIVAPNYRLGPFGFLAHAALTMEDPNYRSSGNYGIADQRAALRWVRDNIAAFGGDPDNVTLAGTSAGAISTSVHLVSPGSRSLFGRAIMQSGHASFRLSTAFDAEAQGEAFATALGCTDRAGVLACLRSKSINQVLSALPAAGLTGGLQQFADPPGRVSWGPIVDGLEVPDQPRELYRRGLFTRIPIIIGANRDDGWTFVDRSFPGGLDTLQYERTVRSEFGMDADTILGRYPPAAFPTPKDALAALTTDVEFVCENRRIARAMDHDGAPVYVYSFEYTVDAVNPGRAFHGLESTLLFGNNFGAPSNHVLSPVDLTLYNAMSSYWREFAKTGSPNVPGTPVPWPVFESDLFGAPRIPALADRYLRFDRLISEDSYLRDSQCNFWERFYFRSVLGALPAAAR
jgi:para-nitrobenzyl esterase